MIERLNEKILFVDDDPYILKSYKRQFRKKFTVETSDSAKRGLAVVSESGPFAVVVSDYKMPEVDGIEFLSRLKQVDPDIVGIILSGDSDIKETISDEDCQNVFRFLTKPCSGGLLKSTLVEAIEHYRLVITGRG